MNKKDPIKIHSNWISLNIITQRTSSLFCPNHTIGELSDPIRILKMYLSQLTDSDYQSEFEVEFRNAPWMKPANILTANKSPDGGKNNNSNQRWVLGFGLVFNRTSLALGAAAVIAPGRRTPPVFHNNGFHNTRISVHRHWRKK